MKKLFTLFLSLIVFFSTNVYADEEISEKTSSSIDVSELGNADNGSSDFSQIVKPADSQKDSEEKNEIVGDEKVSEQVHDNDGLTKADESISSADANLIDSEQSTNGDVEKETSEIENIILSEPLADEGNNDSTFSQDPEKDQTGEDIVENPTEVSVNEPLASPNTEEDKIVPEVENDNSNELNDSEMESKKEEISEDIQMQKAKVTFRKVDEEGNLLSGAIMQILNSDGKVIAEWKTTNEPYEIELSAGEYTIHEEKEPDGYEKANDGKFKVEVIINEDVVGTITNFSNPAGGVSIIGLISGKVYLKKN